MRAIHRRISQQDRFGRAFYCKHARLGLIRQEKKEAKRRLRLYTKEQGIKMIEDIDRESEEV